MSSIDNLFNIELLAQPTLIVAFLVGIIDAICGAWKDTKYEPFEWVKFARSPVMGIIAGIVIDMSIYPLYIQLFFYAGMVRLMAEVYKQVVYGIRYKPGKFDEVT